MQYQADLLNTLQTIPWFLELKGDSLQRLASIAEICQVPAQEELFREGEKVDYLYILLEGQICIEVFVPNRGRVCIFTAEPLDVIGWSSLTPVVRQRTASARATKPCKVLAFHAGALRHLCEEDHDLGYIIMRRIANVTASRLLTTRLQLLDIIVRPSHENAQVKTYSE